MPGNEEHPQSLMGSPSLPSRNLACGQSASATLVIGVQNARVASAFHLLHKIPSLRVPRDSLSQNLGPPANHPLVQS